MLTSYSEEVILMERFPNCEATHEMFIYLEDFWIDHDLVCLRFGDVCGMTRADIVWLAEWGIAVEGDERE